jgi:endonuclease/exonuclease/phosphatase family metal-dependent hydrolase
MRIAYYNQMYAGDGQTALGVVRDHIQHWQSKYEGIEARADLNRTIEAVRRASADVLVISEVLGKEQRGELIQALEVEGYTHFHTGTGHPLNDAHGFVEMLVATRMESTKTFAPDLKLPAQMGYGGGMVGVEISGDNLHILSVHLPLPKGWPFGNLKEFHRQLDIVIEEIERIQRAHLGAGLVLMGDFNYTYEKLLQLSTKLTVFEKLSVDEPTCSMTPLIKLIESECVDLIMGLGVVAQDKGLIQGASDHALIWVDVDGLDF